MWDVLFYDIRSLSHQEAYSALDPFVEEGAVIVISPEGEMNGCRGFELFASEKVGCDQLETNRLRADENVSRFVEKYGDTIDTVAIAGCGSSLMGTAAFGKTVAKARGKPVAAIVAGLGMRDLLGQIMSGALLFQPANLAWGGIDWFLKQSREVLQRSTRENVAELEHTMPSSVASFSKATRQATRKNLDIFHETAAGAANTLQKFTQQTQDTFKDSALRVASIIPFGEERKSLTERYLEMPIEEDMPKGQPLDDFVDTMPACAALHKLLQCNAQGTVLLVGHSKGAYAISLVAWAMMRGDIESTIRETFEKTAQIVTFGCGVRLPRGLKKAYQCIGEWDILGKLNTPGIHLPFLPRELSLPWVQHVIDVNWRKRTLHTTSTLNQFSMPVADLLEEFGYGGRRGAAGQETGQQPRSKVVKMDAQSGKTTEKGGHPAHRATH